MRFMEKRTYKRIPVQLFITVFNDDYIYDGLMINISESGVYFISRADLSSGSNIQVSIPFEQDILKVSVKIKRVENTYNEYDGFAAELLKSSQDYIRFVCKWNSQLKPSPYL